MLNLTRPLAVIALVVVAGAAQAQYGYFGGYNGMASGYLGAQPLGPTVGIPYNMGYTTNGASGYGPSYGGFYSDGNGTQDVQYGQNYSDTAAPDPAGSLRPLEAPAVRPSQSIDAHIDPQGRLRVQWQGDPKLVHMVTFALTDSSGKTLKSIQIVKLPVQAVFTLTNKTAYYQTVVQYVDGSEMKVKSPL